VPSKRGSVSEQFIQVETSTFPNTMQSATVRQLLARSCRARLGRPSLCYCSPPRAPAVVAIGVDDHYQSSTARRTFAAQPSKMSQLKELRSMSGAPIVDCKKALAETDGDLEQAMDWLRQHGVAKAARKLSGRDAEEGVVACAVSSDAKSASIVKMFSETDFAGKSDTFLRLATHVAEATLTADATGDLSPESVMKLESDSKSVQMALEEAIVAIRENLGLSVATKMTAQNDTSILVAYVHGKVDASSNAGSAAAIVEIASVGAALDPVKASEAGKKLAMHIVAAKPLYLDRDSVPNEIVEREEAILLSQVSDKHWLCVVRCYSWFAQRF
jgi:elongation factor Ts